MQIESRHKLISMIQADEGYRKFVYQDTTGHLTVGCGRNLQDVGVSLNEALFLLNNDVARVEVALTKYVIGYDRLDDARKCVLISMAYNLGVGGLIKFRDMLSDMQDGKWEDAANEMLKSEWATQVGQRAVRLANIMRTGVL